MKLKIMLSISLILFLLIIASTGMARDTGTYEIEDYTVALAPRENGSVEITYYQKWKVLGGNIPWITVGLPNPGFSVVASKTGKNISRIKPNNSGSWYGVHITLDRTYRESETFEIEFAVIQKKLFYKHQNSYRLHFIPGWYDRARINRLTVTLNFFKNLDGVTARPRPDSVQAQSLSWEKYGIKKAGRFPVYIDFPTDLFPKTIQLSTNKKSSKTGPIAPGFLIFLVIFLFLASIIAIATSRKNHYGSGGNIRAGGKTGTHRPGCVVSCACACVACACACACAGGGAAGCDRKLTFSCPLCKDCENEDCHQISF